MSVHLNIPNWLTLSRIVLVPVFVGVYLLEMRWSFLAAAGLFALAAFTDWLDGYLARRLGQTTPFGAFLDPVADKIIVVTALVLLIGTHHSLWLTLPGMIIIGREIVISALREWMAEMNRRGDVRVGALGKVKTTIQMVAIVVLLARTPDTSDIWIELGYALLFAAAVLTLWSMLIYLRAAWPSLHRGLEGEGRVDPESARAAHPEAKSETSPL